FFNDTATTEIYTLSLHDALPILGAGGDDVGRTRSPRMAGLACVPADPRLHGHGAHGGDGIQPYRRPRHRRTQSTHEDASPAGGTDFAGECLHAGVPECGRIRRMHGFLEPSHAATVARRVD